VIRLSGVQNAFFRNCRAPEGTGVFLKIEESSENITLMGNDLGRATKIFEIGLGIDARVIFEQGNRPPRA
jgi:hypothetical protein